MKKIISKLMWGVFLFSLSMSLTSCDDILGEWSRPTSNRVTPGTDKQGEVTSITVDLSKIDEKYLDTEKTKLQLTVGDEVTLSFTILPEEMASTEVELTAADATILSIDGLKVKALKEGETKVTAKAGEKTAECTVTVKAAEIPVTGVSLDKTALAMTIGDADVQLNVTVTPADATNADVDWESDDLSVATVDGAGIVHAVADGTATITAKAGGKSATCTVTVSKKAASIRFVVTAINKTVGDAAFRNAPTIEGDGTVESYSSSDTDVATVATDGTVTIKGAGSTTITVKVANGAKNSYSPNTASYTLTVAKKDGSISYTTTEISKSVGNDAFTNELTKVGDGSVSYASDNTAVATVNATTGEVTIVGAGTANITATVADSDTYTYATTTASYTLTVSQAVKKLDPFGNGGNPLGS